MKNIIDPGLSVGEIVRSNYRAAEIFKKYKIDFCCGGSKSINQVCSEKNIPVDHITSELSELSNQDSSNLHNYDEWELDFLTNYIINVHHKYVNNNAPIIQEYVNKIAHVHGERHPELIKVMDLFSEVSTELQQHMMKEEQILFPFIIKLNGIDKNKTAFTPPPFGTIRNPIKMMEAEHENAGNIFKEIREITNDYSLPADACNTYNIAFQKLDEFENDLFRHIHLENNILFPKAIEMEIKLSGVN